MWGRQLAAGPLLLNTSLATRRFLSCDGVKVPKLASMRQALVLAVAISRRTDCRTDRVVTFVEQAHQVHKALGQAFLPDCYPISISELLGVVVQTLRKA